MSAPARYGGLPMDPAAVPGEPLALLPGLPFGYPGASVVIVGPTGRGRSSLVQAALYDAALTGADCAYIGSEVTGEEFNARAADLAGRRGEPVTDELRSKVAHVRYLDIASTIPQAWQDPAGWLEEIVSRYRWVAIDPLSAVASALGLDFDRNAEYVSFYDRLILPATSRSVGSALVDNIGHAEDAKARAKGASAKQDRADVTITCSLSASPPGLIVKGGKRLLLRDKVLACPPVQHATAMACASIVAAEAMTLASSARRARSTGTAVVEVVGARAT